MLINNQGQARYVVKCGPKCRHQYPSYLKESAMRTIKLADPRFTDPPRFLVPDEKALTFAAIQKPLISFNLLRDLGELWRVFEQPARALRESECRARRASGRPRDTGSVEL
jgi:hypothetical protein